MKRTRLVSTAVLLLLLGTTTSICARQQVRAAPSDSGQARIEVLHVPELDAGFRLLYQLKLAEARAQFASWQKSHPQDPLGSTAEAASYLFEECYRQGILTSNFFLDEKRFLGKVAIKPDPDIRAAFFAADNVPKIWHNCDCRRTRTIPTPCSP